MSATVQITGLGALGDGVAQLDGRTIHVPFALPGEIVSVAESDGKFRIEEIQEGSPERVEPACRHFGRCGGCQMQHLAEEPYRRWKRNLVVSALRREDIDAPVGKLIGFGLSQRRRLVMTARRESGAVRLGFLAQGSHDIVDIDECPVATPKITNHLDMFRAIAKPLLPRRGDLKLSVLAEGDWLDLAARSPDDTPERGRQSAIEIAAKKGIARLSLNGEILMETRPPRLKCGKALVVPPPGGFVQAVAAAERLMAQLVIRHLGNCRHVADLFCGHGAFTLRLAEHAEMLAADSDASAIAALERAWRETGGMLKRVDALRRDLFRRPFQAEELDEYDGVVFDPPRAGAEAQARQLAGSKVERVVAVSCNPVTLARDLTLLRLGGYRVENVAAIDQFLFSPHVEVVALLRRN